MEYLYFILTFYVGMFCGYALRNWVLRRMAIRKGVIFVTDEQGLRSFYLQLEEDPDTIEEDRKSTRLNSSHIQKSRMPSSA